MFTHNTKYRDVNLEFSSFAPRHRLSKLISALGLASVVILNNVNL